MKNFEYEVPLRWGDMDAMGHLNNVMYFRLMEEARIAWFAQLGIATVPRDEAPILAHVSCDFLRAMTWPAVTVVRHTTTKIGRASVEMAIAIERRDEPGQPYASGRSVIVWYDYNSGKSAPWPSELRALLE